jgi:hypothetical protein
MKNKSFECGLIKLGKFVESVQQNKLIHNGVQVVFVPWLGDKSYPRGSFYTGRHIRQEDAAELISARQVNKIKGLVYDRALPGFDPFNKSMWPVRVDK